MMSNTIKHAIVGSRTIHNYPAISKILKQHDIQAIISGGAKGVDTLANTYADKHNIEIVNIYPKWNTHGKKAGYIRNKQIVNLCNVVLAFWDGKSKGTTHSFTLAKQLHKDLYIYVYNVNKRCFELHLHYDYSAKQQSKLDDF